MKTLVIIPSRLSATRLPGKPLLKINGLSIVSHVVKKAESANIGEVIVAAEDQKIIDDVKKYQKTKIHNSTKVFQALRILVNKEISELINALINSFHLIPIGGVIAVVTFHSIEDKIVKFFFKQPLSLVSFTSNVVSIPLRS